VDALRLSTLQLLSHLQEREENPLAYKCYKNYLGSVMEKTMPLIPVGGLL